MKPGELPTVTSVSSDPWLITIAHVSWNIRFLLKDFQLILLHDCANEWLDLGAPPVADLINYLVGDSVIFLI